MHILIVDDSRSSLAFLVQKVRELGGHDVEAFLDPLAALDRCSVVQFDLGILDNVMPGVDGVEVTRRLRARDSYRLVPIVMVTSDSNKDLRLAAVAAGAHDFLPKPFETVELQARVRNLLALRQAQIELADRARWLMDEVETATRHVVEREEELIWRLARAIEYRDGDTGEHVSRVALISRLIAESVGLPPERCRIIYLAAPLHDIGKIGVPDHILRKPARLTDDEYQDMKRHTLYGYDAIVATEAVLVAAGASASAISFLRFARQVARSHHEKWDGSGYPDGLRGDGIPLAARLMSVADVYDALTSRRVYKPGVSHEQTIVEILNGRGTYFDPDVVEAFRARGDDFQAIALSYAERLPS